MFAKQLEASCVVNSSKNSSSCIYMIFLEYNHRVTHSHLTHKNNNNNNCHPDRSHNMYILRRSVAVNLVMRGMGKSADNIPLTGVPAGQSKISGPTFF